MNHVDRSPVIVQERNTVKSAQQLLGVVLTVLFLIAAPLQTLHANVAKPFGEVHFPIACDIAVQEKFDLGMAMLHTFSFPAAAETFSSIAKEDPTCAMAYWGLAATAIGSLYG